MDFHKLSRDCLQALCMKNNIRSLQDYASDISAHLGSLELKLRPVPNYTETVQKEISAYSRNFLVKFLIGRVELQQILMDSEVICLAVSYIDRCLFFGADSLLQSCAAGHDCPDDCLNNELQRCTGYKIADLKNCILALRDLQLNMSRTTTTAIQAKYMRLKLNFVSLMLPPSFIPAKYFVEPTVE